MNKKCYKEYIILYILISILYYINNQFFKIIFNDSKKNEDIFLINCNKIV